MSPKQFVGYLEELIDLKVRQYAEMQIKTSPELSHLLQQKRESDRRRLDQLRRELVAILEA